MNGNQLIEQGQESEPQDDREMQETGFNKFKYVEKVLNLCRNCGQPFDQKGYGLCKHE